MHMLTSKDFAFLWKKFDWNIITTKNTDHASTSWRDKKIDPIKALWMNFMSQSIKITNMMTKQKNNNKLSYNNIKSIKKIWRKHWNNVIWTSNMRSQNEIKEKETFYVWIHLSVYKRKTEHVEKIYQCDV